MGHVWDNSSKKVLKSGEKNTFTKKNVYLFIGLTSIFSIKLLLFW